MASASSTLRVNPHPYGVDNTQRRQIINGTCILSPSGTYINTANASSGIPLNWHNMQDGRVLDTQMRLLECWQHWRLLPFGHRQQVVLQVPRRGRDYVL